VEAAAFTNSARRAQAAGVGTGAGAGGAGEGGLISDTVESMDVVDDDLVWCGGVGTTATVTPSSKLDANRAEVLRL
jgi:hypothetical protein